MGGDQEIRLSLPLVRGFHFKERAVDVWLPLMWLQGFTKPEEQVIVLCTNILAHK